METSDRRLSKIQTAHALGIDVKTLTRWLKRGYFPGPAAIVDGVNWWTMRQVERHIDDDRPV